MNPMAKHSKLTRGQSALAGGFVFLGFALTPMAFIVMLITVMHLLIPSLGAWAWTVPVGTEVGFVAFFCADLLTEWKRRPLKLLRVAPWLFAAISLTLNVYAAWGNVAGMLGHAVLPILFFGYILVAEALVRRLAVTEDERLVEVAMGDALAHARDLVRDRLGLAWRLRCPSLLRRQLRSRRATAAVRTAAENAARHGQHQELETVTAQWVADGLAVRVKAEVSGQNARREIASQGSPQPSQALLGPSPAVSPASSGKSPGASSRATSRKPSKAAVRKMSGAELAGHVERLLEEDPALTVTAVMDAVHVGRPKAQEALGAAQDRRRQSRIAAVR